MYEDRTRGLFLDWTRPHDCAPINDTEGNCIKKIAFISGPALGHVGRLYEIAKKLVRRADVEITFYIADYTTTAEMVIGNAFRIKKIPIPAETRHHPFEAFADGIEKCFQHDNVELIVHDGCPLRWLSTTRFPDCPRVFVTNAFLTGHHNRDTFQSRWFDKPVHMKINHLRAEKGLPAISSPFELYDADKVILADARFLIPRASQFPEHFHFCGPIHWGSRGEIPESIANLTDHCIISMGSTGKRNIERELLARLRSMTGCEKFIYAGRQASDVKNAGLIEYAFEWLPLDQLYSHAGFAVTQGGSGSTYQAIAKGVPSLTFPTHINQEIFGNILEKAGLSVCIGLNDNLEKIENFDIDSLRDAARGASLKMSGNGAIRAAKHLIEMI
ncbi:MAG: hypothetical protein HKN36_06150 [Hellea sp.]|nr:hypothetical protein [Hellea sp.]